MSTRTENALLGMPEEAEIDAMLLTAVKANPEGVSAREMARKHPARGVGVLDWLAAGARLHRAKLVRHGWRCLPVAVGGGATLQEGVFTAPSEAP
jgi:hypothetical protein